MGCRKELCVQGFRGSGIEWSRTVELGVQVKVQGEAIGGLILGIVLGFLFRICLGSGLTFAPVVPLGKSAVMSRLLV